jgi:molecular chaperone DnaK (HSP70)
VILNSLKQFVHREAAGAAGFNVLRLIHEPSAALLAYGIGQASPTGKR